MRWPQIVFVVLGVLAVALAVKFRDKPARAPRPTAAPVSVGRPLAPSFERAGMISRRIGLMRVYLAVPAEVPLISVVEGTRHRAVAVPISVTIENDTYQPLLAPSLGWLGQQLATVKVARLVEGERDAEIFDADLPLPARADWLSAERRSFSLDWPLRDVTAGTYRVSVQLALPDQPVVEIVTRVL